MLLWPRLHFRDGGTLHLAPVDDWNRDRFEREWKALGVRVEWLRSPRGRLDRALSYDASGVDNSGANTQSPE